MTTTQLRQIYDAACAAEIKHVNAMNSEKWDERKKACDAVDAAIEAKYGKEKVRLAMNRAAAKAELEAALIADAKGILLKGRFYPVGAKLVMWDHGCGWNWHPLRKTSTMGIVEVITPQTIFPRNGSRWDRPNAGDCAIRILLKDGTPSKKFAHRSDVDNFYPEGVEPK